MGYSYSTNLFNPIDVVGNNILFSFFQFLHRITVTASSVLTIFLGDHS